MGINYGTQFTFMIISMLRGFRKGLATHLITTVSDLPYNEYTDCLSALNLLSLSFPWKRQSHHYAAFIEVTYRSVCTKSECDPI